MGFLNRLGEPRPQQSKFARNLARDFFLCEEGRQCPRRPTNTLSPADLHIDQQVHISEIALLSICGQRPGKSANCRSKPTASTK